MIRNLIIIFLVVLTACKQKPAANKEKTNQQIFAVSPFVAEQLKAIDSLNLPIIKYVIVNGDTTAGLVSSAEIKQASTDFTTPDISEAPLKSNYTESSFADQSIPNITLSYTTSNRELPVQRLDVILQPDPVGSDRVKTVYLEKTAGDTSKKLLWRADVSFQIVSTAGNGSKIVKFDWSGTRVGF